MVVSLPTKTPLKIRDTAEKDIDVHSSTPGTDRLIDRSRGTTPRSLSTPNAGNPGSATNTDRLTDRSRGTPGTPTPTGGLNNTMPTPSSARRNNGNNTGARGTPNGGLSSTAALGATQVSGTGTGTGNGTDALNHTSPGPSALAQAALLSSRSGVAAREVTINEHQNTVSSPGPSPQVALRRNNAIPDLKPAGAASAMLDDMQDVNALVRQARLSASPRGLQASESDQQDDAVSGNGGHRRPNERADAAASAALDARAARAKASYLMKKSAPRAKGDNDDYANDERASSHSSSFSRSGMRKTSTSQVSKLLSASQEGGWAKNVTSQLASSLGGKGWTGAQETLFLSMRKVLPVGSRGGCSSGSVRSSGEAKSGGGSSRYDSDEDTGSRGSPKRPSTASSVRSSRSGGGGGMSHASSSSQKSLKVSSSDIREISNRLTQPVKSHYTAADRKNDPTLKYLLLEEARECERKPFKSKPWAESNRAAADAEDKDSGFTERMEGQERARRQAMEDRINQEAYDCRLDRKECPNCHSKQSYNEMKMKITKCTICNEEFKPSLTWAQVSKRFFQRGKGYEEKSKSTHEKLKTAIESEHVVQAHKFNPKTGKVEVVAAADAKRTRWDDDLGTQFFSRMEEKLNLREERLEKVEADTFGTVCTFQPKITKRKKQGGEEDEDEEEEEEENAAMQAQAFMMRLEEDMEARRKAHPEKYMPKHHKKENAEGKMPIWT